jgi:hypothetical protein
MTLYENRTFEEETIRFEGNEYRSCVFNRCTMIFTADVTARDSTDRTFTNPKFNDCFWRYEGAAHYAFSFLNNLFRAGYGNEVEALFASIRPAKPEVTTGNELDAIFEEIIGALNSRLYYLAISTALTIPDICAALESANGESSTPQYKDWYERYLSKEYPNLTPKDCWVLRCGVSHQGSFGHPGSQYSRVVFTLPHPHGHVLHNNRGPGDGSPKEFINLDAIRFCEDFIEAAQKWLSENSENTTIRANLPRIVRYRPNGLDPHITGVEVIA